MIKLKLAYFGSPQFSADLLEKLRTDSSIKHLIEVKLVITQPDRPVGRKQVITPSPVKLTARKFGLECLEIENWKFSENWKLKIGKCDLALVYAFGKIIPKEILSLPQLGFWNIHPSLLPKYRGPSPIAYPLINDDKKTGVTIIKMDQQIDHGPIINQEKLEILPNDRRPDLEIKLTNLALQMFNKTVNQLTSLQVNELKIKEQDHKKATYTKLLKKSDGFIPFENLKLKIENSPKQLFNLFRGLYPWPGIWTQIQLDQLPKGRQLRLKITDLALIKDKLIIKKVQLEGKKEVDFKTFSKAYKIFLPRTT